MVNDRRQPHAVLNLSSRTKKAIKIERLLELTPAPDRRKLLEIGTGSGGIAYLAVPNLWMVLEPHYRLAFLSWVPRCWRTLYLRLTGRGSNYDCEPPTKPQLEAMLAAGLRYRFLSSKAVAVMCAVEGRDDWLLRLVTAVPESLLNLLGYWNPTLIYSLQRLEPTKPR